MERGLVLVVEDEPAIAELVALYLRRDGFGVQVESSGDAALAAVRALSPVAVVLDVGLPGMNGIEVCRALRAAGDWTPVLFVTARDDEQGRTIGMQAVSAAEGLRSERVWDRMRPMMQVAASRGVSLR